VSGESLRRWSYVDFDAGRARNPVWQKLDWRITRGWKAHECGVGFFERFPRVIRLIRTGSYLRQRRAPGVGDGKAGRASPEFFGWHRGMNRGENPKPAVASGTFQHIDFEGTVFILHLPQWN
jgi:hypothetical protein